MSLSWSVFAQLRAQAWYGKKPLPPRGNASSEEIWEGAMSHASLLVILFKGHGSVPSLLLFTTDSWFGSCPLASWAVMYFKYRLILLSLPTVAFNLHCMLKYTVGTEGQSKPLC